MHNGYYGAYQTRTFGEIFPSDTAFANFYSTCGIPAMLESGTAYNKFNINTIYALLCANYMNSHIKSSSEDRFKLKVMEIIYKLGPTWQREMYLQDQIRKMTMEDMMKGSDALYNHARHPDTEPATSAREHLPYIDEQNATLYNKDKVKALLENMTALDDRTTDRFLSKFKNLFIQIAYPGRTLDYESEEE